MSFLLYIVIGGTISFAVSMMRQIILRLENTYKEEAVEALIAVVVGLAWPVAAPPYLGYLLGRYVLDKKEGDWF